MQNTHYIQQNNIQTKVLSSIKKQRELEDIMLSKISQPQENNMVYFHLCDGLVQLTQVVNEMVAGRSEEKGN